MNQARYWETTTPEEVATKNYSQTVSNALLCRLQGPQSHSLDSSGGKQSGPSNAGVCTSTGVVFRIWNSTLQLAIIIARKVNE